MPHQIALITDSTCDLPLEWRMQYEIAVVPLTIVWGDMQYLDGVDLSPEEFYEHLPHNPHHPSTSQPTPAAFLEAYRKAAEGGASEVLVLTISSAMSGTIESARRAAQESPIPVHIHDSKSNSMGLGWQVVAAARARQGGASARQMLAAAEKARKAMNYYISLDTMEYLVKGGRIGSATRFLSSLLNIKPLIYVNHESGTVAPSIPARSRASAINGLVSEYFKHVKPGAPLHLTVLHNAALDEARQLAERVTNEYHPAEVFISIVSPVLGAHTGPRAIALCGYFEE